MEIKVAAVAGTLESSDVQIRIEPKEEDGVSLEVDSIVEMQFGDEIRRVILETAEQLQIEKAHITVVDKGALNCTLRARALAAFHRAMEREDYDWRNL